MRGTVPAVVTAGGRIRGELAAAAGTDVKALIPMEGPRLVERVLTALRESARVVEPVVVVGPESELKAALKDCGSESDGGQSIRLIAEGETGPENMVRGLSALPDSRDKGWALLCTCDLPFLTGDAVGWLLDNAPEDADIVFPIVTKEEYEAEFPGTPGTYVRIDGGQYTGGSVFLVRPSVIARNQALIERVFSARKDALAMARLGGVALIGRFLTGVLTVEYVEAKASQLTGCRCRAVKHAPPSLAADVDTMEDYRFACRHLTVRGVRA